MPTSAGQYAGPVTAPSPTTAGVWTNPKICLPSILGIAALTRFLFLGGKSFWLDEGASVALARLNGSAFIQRLWSHEANMAVYYLLLRGWLHFGSSEFWIRSLSVVPGLATVPVVYVIGRKLFDQRVGLMAALLLSVHVGHVAYSQEARGYSLAVFFAALSCLYFLRLMERSGTSDVALYVVFSVLAVYTHFFASLILAAQCVSLIGMPPRQIPWRRLIISVTLIVVCCVPAVVFAFSEDVGQLNWVRKTNLRELHHTATLLTGNGLVLVAYLLLWILGIAAATSIWRKAGRSSQSWPYTFVISWLFTPLVLALLISMKKSVLAPRFLLTSVPAAVLLASVGIVRLRTPVRAVTLGLVFLLSAGALAGYYKKPKEDWRAVTRYVLNQAQPDDLVVIYPQWDGVAVDYYRGRMSESSPQPRFQEIPPGEFRQAAQLPVHQRLWLVVYAWRLTQDPETQALQRILDRTYSLTGTQNFGDIAILRYQARAH